MSDNTIPQFNFGENWDNFSKHVLTEEKIAEARQNFKQLFQNQDVSNKTFLDIGFGQGISLLIANESGSIAVGNDINPICNEVLQHNKRFFSPSASNIDVVVGSILDSSVVEQIKKIHPTYDIVHSWGVLHHTGNMWKAIDISAQLVADKGKLVLAIYNRHWSSALWLVIKKMYNISPAFVQKIMIGTFYVIILAAKFLVTFKNPFKHKRGMNFYYNVVDWVGGYPYEYASRNEIQQYVEKLGFTLSYFQASHVPTGCHEYVFVKND